MEFFLPFAVGLGIGLVIAVIIVLFQKRTSRDLLREIAVQNESQRIQELEAVVNRIKESFATLSLDALSRNTSLFLNMANETLTKQTQAGEKELEGKKKLIDQTLETIRTDLRKVEEVVTGLEKDRERKFGELTTQLKSAAEQTSKLQETTLQLRSALANSKVRGQWGERMAEDILRLAGFIEGINYQKQKGLETSMNRPDYTFLLPQERKVNMDVKFPFDNYLRYLEAQEITEKTRYKNQFLTDVKGRVKEVTTREYINPAENTLDYVIVFIPNEQVYAFINESDNSILDEALKNKVILCSPLTLYAILAVMRQAVDNFNLERTASRILSLLGSFNKQWEAFVGSLEEMGKKIDQAQKEFDKLSSTRRNQLEKPLRQIEEIRTQKGIPIEPLLPEPKSNPSETRNQNE